LKNTQRYEHWDNDLQKLRTQSEHLPSAAQERLEWFIFAHKNNCSAEVAAKHFNISPSTFRRWEKRFDPRDLSTLEEQSRRPHIVRESDIEPQVIELIRQYRKKHTTMGKEHVAEQLEQEHGITLSPSSVGRIIQRHRMYFANTISHRKKLQGHNSDDAYDTGDHDAPAGRGGTDVLSLLFVAAAIAGSLLIAPTVDAENMTSSSYQMTSNFPNEASERPQTASSYQLRGEVTWEQKPASSSSYQVTTDPAAAEEADAGDDAGGEDDAGDTTPPRGGGRRGTPSTDGYASPLLHEAAEEETTEEPTEEPDEERSKRERLERAPLAELVPTVYPGEPAESVAPVFEPTGVDRVLERRIRAPRTGVERVSVSTAREHRFAQAIALGALGVAALGIVALSAVLGLAATQQIVTTTVIGIKAIIDFIGFCLKGIARVPKILFFAPFTSGAIEEKKKKKAKRRVLSLFIGLIALGIFALDTQDVYAQTGPQKQVYNGHLLDEDGDAITTAHKIRFSYWKSTDYVSTDVTATGAINTGATNYADWQEVHTVTPDSNGYFSVQLGTGTSLPNLASYSPSDLQSLHLQVEVKASSAADTSYELLDVDSSSTTIDRSPLLAVPFAIHADLLDQRHVGTGSGSIPVLGEDGDLSVDTIPHGTSSGSIVRLQSGGLLPQSTVGTGTLLREWVIDADNSEPGSIDLVFGGSLGKILSYNQSNNYFNFNDDVNVQGDLTVTGLVNGIDIATLGTYTGSHLRVSSGGGLNVKVTAGAYSLSGSIVDFVGDSGINVTDDTTNYVFVGSGGMTVNTSGFPTDESAIRLAEVVTQNGGVKTVTDRRVLNSDNRERSIEKDYHAEFEHTIYQADATNNVGQLTVDHDNTNLHNYYKWTSSRTSLQDYDVIVRMTLSSEFVRWNSGSIVVKYRSTSASSDDNQMDISLFDTNGSPVTITGDSTDFASTSWATTTLNFGGSPTWTPGQDFLMKFKMHAKDDKQMHLGGITLKYVDFQQH